MLYNGILFLPRILEASPRNGRQKLPDKVLTVLIKVEKLEERTSSTSYFELLRVQPNSAICYDRAQYTRSAICWYFNYTTADTRGR